MHGKNHYFAASNGSNFVQSSSYITYLIPIKILAPLIFAHLACAKIKKSKFAQYEYEWMKIYSKIMVREN